MPARDLAAAAARSAMAAVTAGDREGWLACYAPDAVLRDPVGGSPLDPHAQGLRGREARELFWDLAIGPHRVEFDIAAVHPSGAEAAVVARVRTWLSNGAETAYNGVFVYTVDAAGAITELRGYWDPAVVLAALGTGA